MPTTATTESQEQRAIIFTAIKERGESYYAEAYDFEKRRWDDVVLKRVQVRDTFVVEARDTSHFTWPVKHADILDTKQFRSFIPKLH